MMFAAPGVDNRVYRDLPTSELAPLVWGAKGSVIHVETLDHYGVPDDDLMFTLWQSGKTPTQEQLLGYASWFDKVKESTERGVAFHRIHIVPEVLTPYLRFEIEFAYQRFCEPSGEKVWILPKEANKKLAAHIPGDFYLIDQRQVLLPQYNSANNFVGLKEVVSGGSMDAYRSQADELLRAAMPLEAFYRAMMSAPLRVVLP